jgi:hypothetical protein
MAARTNRQCEEAAKCIPSTPEWKTFRMVFNIAYKAGHSCDEAIALATAETRLINPGFIPTGIDRRRLKDLR